MSRCGLCHNVKSERPALSAPAKRHHGMGLPGWKNIKVAWTGKHVLRHSCAKRLEVIVLRTVKTKLTIKTCPVDLRGDV